MAEYLSSFSGVDASQVINGNSPRPQAVTAGRAPGDTLLSAIIIAGGTIGADVTTDFNGNPVQELIGPGGQGAGAIGNVSAPFNGPFLIQSAGPNLAGTTILGLFQKAGT